MNVVVGFHEYLPQRAVAYETRGSCVLVRLPEHDTTTYSMIYVHTYMPMEYCETTVGDFCYRYVHTHVHT